MLSDSQLISAGAVLLSVVAIAWGGTFVLSVVRGRVPANDLQKAFYRAGHAHAGVLVTLGLVVMILVHGNDVPQPWAGLSSAVLFSALLIPGGFFLSVLGRNPAKPNGMIALLWLGVAVLVAGLVSAGVGLIITGSG